MAVGNVEFAARLEKETSAMTQLKRFLGRYFYLCMSLVMAGLVVWGFSRTVDASLFHANPAQAVASLDARRRILNLGAVLHRAVDPDTSAQGERSSHARLVWSWASHGHGGAGPYGRGGHDPLRYGGAPSARRRFFSIDSILGHAGVRHVHRSGDSVEEEAGIPSRLVFVATCELMDAAIGRFDFWFNHSIFYVGLDILIVLGVVRDLVADGRIHKVYLYALPVLVAGQSITVYLWRANPAWWQAVTHAILGL